MCYRVRCPSCGKTGWEGCGQHIDSVMNSVPVSQRCRCNDNPAGGTEPRAGSKFWRR